MNDNELMHYGTPRRSGRYPWGSGENPYQHEKGFLGYVNDLKNQGLSEKDIAEGLGMSIRQLRAKKSIEKDEKWAADAAEALRLKDKGYSNVAIGERMGIGESQVRNLLNPALQQRRSITSKTMDVLKDSVEKHGYIDVGLGCERYLGISRTKLLTAIEELKDQGYSVENIQVEQLGTGEKTIIQVLAPEGTTYRDIVANKDKIAFPFAYSENGGRSYRELEKPKSISSDRIKIRYSEDGGSDMDGVIQLRRGVDDLSLGKSHYAQVRIAVDGTHYLKGMAVYSDDMPDGVDIIFNTNKHKGTPKMDVLKEMKYDEYNPSNPFGATIRQQHYIDKNGKEQLSALNIVNEEGDWSTWSRTLSSQFLSKQRPDLAKKQLDLYYEQKVREYEEIKNLTNPAVKRRLLEPFADDCDASAVHLKAAALPRQSSSVILPVPDISDNEIYAPNYRNGEKVVLVRHPHAGPFESPELIVNNNNKYAKKVIGNAEDAVGISAKTASILSGADFDGDTVLVIPNNRGEVKTKSPLKGLKDFDPKESYPAYEGMPRVSPENGFYKQREMGKVSNLITDMTLKGAADNDIAAAVRHSMVIIDAEKHNLNWKQSALDNNIPYLKQKYQGGKNRGASTLISKSSSEARVKTGESYINKSGKVVDKTRKSTKMAEVDDAYLLSSGTPMENIYAEHANKLKALAKDIRTYSESLPSITYSKSARDTYSKEVASLNTKLNVAIMNKPKERQAQILANTVIDVIKADNPNLTFDELKKLKAKELATARTRVGAKKEDVKITDKEWEAIQAGAVSQNLLKQILDNTNLDLVRQLATPRTEVVMTPNMIARAQSMAKRGYTQAQIADQLGVSTSTVVKYIE